MSNLVELPKVETVEEKKEPPKMIPFEERLRKVESLIDEVESLIDEVEALTILIRDLPNDVVEIAAKPRSLLTVEKRESLENIVRQGVMFALEHQRKVAIRSLKASITQLG